MNMTRLPTISVCFIVFFVSFGLAGNLFAKTPRDYVADKIQKIEDKVKSVKNKLEEGEKSLKTGLQKFAEGEKKLRKSSEDLDGALKENESMRKEIEGMPPSKQKDEMLASNTRMKNKLEAARNSMKETANELHAASPQFDGALKGLSAAKSIVQAIDDIIDPFQKVVKKCLPDFPNISELK